MQESFLEEAAPRGQLEEAKKAFTSQGILPEKRGVVLTWLSTQLCGAFSRTFTSVATVARGRGSQEEWPQGEARAAYN